jgi:hypothetical protein
MYDTIQMSTAVAVHSAFISKMGSTSKPKQVTNMLGNGELPLDHVLEIKRITISLHDTLVLADIEPMLDASYLEFFLNDQTMFTSPLRYLMANNAYSGVLELASAAAHTKFGLLGQGYELDPPIVIEANLPIKVEVGQTVVLSAATNILIGLHGVLTRPGER